MHKLAVNISVLEWLVEQIRMESERQQNNFWYLEDKTI